MAGQRDNTTLRLVLVVTAGAAIAAAAIEVQKRRKTKRSNHRSLSPTRSYASIVANSPLPKASGLASPRSNNNVKFDSENVVSNMLAGPMMENIQAHMHMNDDKPIIVGVAGGSGSGKTTLARAVYENLGKDNVTYICHDSYYRDLSHLPVEERALTNFDHPASLETDLLVRHLQALKERKEVNVPFYDFSCHSRSDRVTRAVPRKVVILEGILIFSDAALRNEMDIKIFVDTEADIRFIRRLERDITERGRSPDSVIRQYLSTVRPMHEQFVEPAKQHCDIIVPVGVNSVVLDMVVSRLRFAIGK